MNPRKGPNKTPIMGLRRNIHESQIPLYNPGIIGIASKTATSAIKIARYATKRLLFFPITSAIPPRYLHIKDLTLSARSHLLADWEESRGLLTLL
jgi:hypothetical protein